MGLEDVIYSERRKKMPKASDSKRKYDKKYNSTKKHKLERAQRNAARKKLMDEGVVHKNDGKDVEHSNPIRNGGTNKRSNLKVMNKSKNRAMNGGLGGAKKKMGRRKS